MRLVAFTADNPAAALAQIHSQLGPEAVVLNVRPLSKPGLSRLWRRTRAVEVLAGVQDPPPQPGSEPALQAATPSAQHSPAHHATASLPVVTAAQAPGIAPPSAANRTAAAASTALRSPGGHPVRSLSVPKGKPASARPHVLVGAPGVGKTALLCKWLTSAVLSGEGRARVWRMDGVSANSSEMIEVYGEMLGVKVERFWRGGEVEEELLLVDVPGVEPEGVTALREQLKVLPNPHVHLVLNAAYDASILFEQIRAFSVLQPEDLSFTHLDEERRHAKPWQIAAGTGCPVRFLSAGQKIPGDFWYPDRSTLIPEKNPRKIRGIEEKSLEAEAAGKGSA